MDTLQLLSMANEFVVERHGESGYTIDMNCEELSARIDNQFNGWYYRTGTYNSGCNWLNINVNALDRLRKFCKLIAELEGKTLTEVGAIDVDF